MHNNVDTSAGARVLGRVMDPRKVEGVYRSGYWQKNYRVDSIRTVGDTRYFTVTWEDGTTGEHCTAWDARDTIISQPAPKA